MSTAALGALVMGAVIFAINVSHGVGAALVAAAKQATYTLCLGSVIIGLCRRLSVAHPSAWRSMVLATLVPSCLTGSLTFGVHMIRGTPEPLLSTLPTLLIVPPSCLIMGLLHRRRARSPQ